MECAQTIFRRRLNAMSIVPLNSQMKRTFPAPLSFHVTRLLRILLSTRGTIDDVTPDMKAFLEYVDGNT